MSTEPAQVATTPTSTIRFLGLVMIGLALARGWTDGSSLARYAVERPMVLLRAPSTVPWDEFSGVAFAAWPMLLGIALVQSRSDRLVKAAAITAFMMGVERLASLVIAGVFDSGWRELYRGSWDPTRGPVGPRGWALAATIVNTAAWLTLGVWAWRNFLASRARLFEETPPEPRGRRREKPRYSNIAAVAFSFGIVIMLGWSTYLTVLDRLPWVRNLVIGERRPNRPFVPVDSPEGRRLQEADRLSGDAQSQQAAGRFLESRQSMIKATNRYESLMEDFPKRRIYRRQFALAANNLAWFLVTCPEKSVREPEAAVLLARKAVAINPDDGNALNTLAVAYFRAGELDQSRAAFERSTTLRGGGDGYDWFFLAQIDAIQGKPETARAMYDKAVEWTLGNGGRNPELFQFRVEAAERLKLPRPEMPAVDPLRTESGKEAILIIPNVRRRGR